MIALKISMAERCRLCYSYIHSMISRIEDLKYAPCIRICQLDTTPTIYLLHIKELDRRGAFRDCRNEWTKT